MWECLKTPYENQQLSPWAFSVAFLRKLFFPEENSQLHSYKKLTNVALETLLKELVTLNYDNNEKTIKEHIKQQQINMTGSTLTALCEHQSWFILN